MDTADLKIREGGPKVATWWRTASYSTLASGHSGSSLDDAEGRDRDETTEEIEEALGVAGMPNAEAAPKNIVLEKFPRGAKAGNFFHEIFEKLDFQADEAIEELVDGKLRAYRFGGTPEDQSAHRISALQAVREVLATPLIEGDGAFALRDVATERRLNELEFHLPVADAASSGKGAGAAPLTPRSLARAFAKHGSSAVPQGYARRIERLRFSKLHGFLKGYVDLVFEQDGRFYVLDYKTNFLGTEPRHYSPKRMAHAMDHGHYFLQYHLYALAVHRYLGRRLAGYDYERHFGGALYLFVRGMSPATGPRLGVFYDKPPLPCMQALSDVLDGVRKETAA